MKILICDQQRMLAEVLACALDARGYDILAVTTTPSVALSSVGDCVPDVCLLGLRPGHPSIGPDTVRALLDGYPGTKVLVLSEGGDSETLFSADDKRCGRPYPSGPERRADRRGA